MSRQQGRRSNGTRIPASVKRLVPLVAAQPKSLRLLRRREAPFHSLQTLPVAPIRGLLNPRQQVTSVPGCATYLPTWSAAGSR